MRILTAVRLQEFSELPRYFLKIDGVMRTAKKMIDAG